VRWTDTTQRIRNAGGEKRPGRDVCYALLLLSPLLSGCAAGGFSIDGAVPDKASITGSVDRAQPNEHARSSDADAVRDVVSVIDTGKIDGGGVPWSNPVTGDSGVIVDVVDRQEKQGSCRLFRASRISYDGVKMFHGKACRDRFGFWSLVEFEPV
jgi:hypothetical protein